MATIRPYGRVEDAMEEIRIDVCGLKRLWREASQNEIAAPWRWGCGEHHFKAATASGVASVEGDVGDSAE